MRNGVLYQLSGASLLPALRASLRSLRRHYAGRVAIVATPNNLIDARSLPVDHVVEGPPLELDRHAAYKCWTYSLTPFDRTVYLDADTVVTGSIEPLFMGNAVCVSQLGKYRFTRRSKLARRFFYYTIDALHESRDSMKRLLACVSDTAPIVNAGVLTFTGGHSFFEKMLQLVNKYPDAHDEHFIQLHLDQVHVISDHWNRSIVYGRAQKPAVWHFHRDRWRPHTKWHVHWKTLLS